MQNVLILAGGESSRMGYPKSFLPFDDNSCFLENIVKTYANLTTVNEIVVVLNSSFFLGFKDVIENLSKVCRFIPNDYPEKERSYSISLGLNSFTNVFPTFIQNVDNPFIDKTTLIDMSNASFNSDEYVISSVNEIATHPILLGKVIVEFIKNDVVNNSLKNKLQKYKKVKINSINEKLLININLPSDYERYFKYFYDEFLI